ncbi:uncharacterized protein BDZ99DRAFT_492915 [Mytilinidion resinicola]|uniref:Uncharacterized protein n=1 Tax=Mytilinidion resinicola TaxID=574789 RepID=A0A6A6Z7C3_9PEZI|nr:uncharacterized protein BDZ99DRAFT_492915 [Mytilinidion resinicola]KAF2817002.1 hypothetical protein BDZ99DRAFT_492915 [Mytilinidion resinicola]
MSHSSIAPPSPPYPPPTHPSADTSARDGADPGFTTVFIFIRQHWWTALCKSAFKNIEVDYLFEAGWFDENGILDINDPRYEPIVSLLIYTHASIIEKAGVLATQAIKPYWIHDHKSGGARVVFKVKPKVGHAWVYMAKMPGRGYIDRRTDRTAYLKSIGQPDEDVDPEAEMNHAKLDLAYYHQKLLKNDKAPIPESVRCGGEAVEVSSESEGDFDRDDEAAYRESKEAYNSGECNGFQAKPKKKKKFMGVW